jgi:hypothetical protein
VTAGQSWDPQAYATNARFVSELGEPLLDAVRQAWDEHAVGGSSRTRPDIVLAELGERAGAMGAALLARGDA